MMHQRWIVSGIVIAVVIAAFLFSVPRTTEIPEDVPAVSSVAVPSVLVEDSVRRGVHTLSGSIEAPDACSTVVAQASYEGADTENAHILLAVTLTLSEGVCLEVPTRMRFTATVTAPAGVPIEATVNGERAELL
jgi:hypothetical protein